MFRCNLSNSHVINIGYIYIYIYIYILFQCQYFDFVLNAYYVDSWLDIWFLGYWEISFIISIWIEIPNESLFLRRENNYFFVLNPYGKSKSFLYNSSRNRWLKRKLRLIHLRNSGLGIIMDWHWHLEGKKIIVFIHERVVWWSLTLTISFHQSLSFFFFLQSKI